MNSSDGFTDFFFSYESTNCSPKLSLFIYSYYVHINSKCEQQTFCWKFFVDSLLHNLLNSFIVERVPALRGCWDLEKIELRKIRVPGTVLKTQLTQKSPTYAYISQNPIRKGPR